MFAEPKFLKLKNCEIAYRVVGSGKPLLLIHGYPLSGLTYRHVAEQLASKFTCYIPDLLGAGETRWGGVTDFSFDAQADTLKAFVDALGLSSYAILAHDTGGTIARALALRDQERITHLALIGTEIPNHRPPWIEFFQKVSRPNRTGLFRKLLGSKMFRESSAAFGGCFWDKKLIHGEFYKLMIEPLVASDERTRGIINYLLGIDWKLVDRLRVDHEKIKTPTLLIWGENDTVFPVEEARPMVQQLGNCKGFVVVPKTRLFVQEERPDVVANLFLEFVSAGTL